MNYTNADFRNGLKLEIDGDPYVITYFQFVKPGKGNAFTRTKLKNLITGRVIDNTFRSGEKVEQPNMVDREMQFLYSDGDEFHFMDNKTYDQVGIDKADLGGAEGLASDHEFCPELEFQVSRFG